MKISRDRYAELYGSTENDLVRLGATDLWIRIEKDLIPYGDELVFGAGNTARDGLGLINIGSDTLDLVITNCIVLDPLIGVIKGDVGIKDGLIVGVGHAGNPFTMDGVTMSAGTDTEVISGEAMICTPAFIDTHIHWVAPQQVWDAISAGFTTMIGGGTGPAEGTKAVTSTPGPWNIGTLATSIDQLPVNVGLLGKASSSEEAMEREVYAGVSGFKIHEDWGAMPRVIDSTLNVADNFDVQVSIHTDTANESGFYEDTVSSIGGRTIHAYYVEGAGGGHALDIIRLAGEPNVLPSSTNPTKPFTRHTYEEHLEMLISVHHLNPKVKEDIAYAESRIREETMAAEDYLHDIGAISMMSSDSQAMGRVGETGIRTFQLAHKMKGVSGTYGVPDDNERVLRYLAKLTINPAITHGISSYVGSISPGKLADIVLWDPRLFPVRPSLIIKGGLIAWALMGETNPSIAYSQPVWYKPMFGSYVPHISLFFSSSVGEENISKVVRKRVVQVKNTRGLNKGMMVRNSLTPSIKMNPDSFLVEVDGVVPKVPPSETLPLTQLYHMF